MPPNQLSRLQRRLSRLVLRSSARATATLLDFCDRSKLNFWRLHVLWFVTNSLLWSVVFYVCNGEYRITYVDSLFLCVSAVTVTGLSTVNLSSITGFQQAILFYLMMIGNYTIVSLVMILVRKQYFLLKVFKQNELPGRPMGRFRTLIRTQTMAFFDTTVTAFDPPVPARDHELQAAISPKEEKGLEGPVVDSHLNVSRAQTQGTPATVSPNLRGNISLPGEVDRGLEDHDRGSIQPPRMNSPSSRSRSISHASQPRSHIHRGIRRTLTQRQAGALPISRFATQHTIPHSLKVTPVPAPPHLMPPNEAYEDLTDREIEEMGGVEYQALSALSWIVAAYWLGTQFTTFIIITAYLRSTSKYDAVFDSLYRPVPKAWFAAFQSVSAYTGGGMSLVDESMVPFRRAYVIVVFLGWIIVAGNNGLPFFLRLIVWILYKLAPMRKKETYRFLLDYPRRCYLYLFPPHQTWFLVVVWLAMTLVGWLGFLILDIRLPAVSDIPGGERVSAGLFQCFAVRSSGFAIVSLGGLAPSVQIIYIILMYISAYPIAISIRATNVYEQRSLGVYYDVSPEDEEEEKDPDIDSTAAKRIRDTRGKVVFGKYLGTHVRRQLQYDVWWLTLAWFLICVTERGPIMASDNETWYNQFTVIFEIISAYATVGLSLGIPTENYSLSGAFRPLSKVIMCFVMLRGRHRDLPYAIDRAILLPHEFARTQIDGQGEHVMGEQDAIAERVDLQPRRTDTVPEAEEADPATDEPASPVKVKGSDS